MILKPTVNWLNKLGWSKQPFSPQENTVAQTFAMAMTGSIWCLGTPSQTRPTSVYTNRRMHTVLMHDPRTMSFYVYWCRASAAYDLAVWHYTTSL